MNKSEEIINWMMKNVTDPDMFDFSAIPDRYLEYLNIEADGSFSHELTSLAIVLYTMRSVKRNAMNMIKLSDEELFDMVKSFGMCCAFERLRRNGMIAAFQIDDPFDLESSVSVYSTITNGDNVKN